jgi:hypothetical protein
MTTLMFLLAATLLVVCLIQFAAIAWGCKTMLDSGPCVRDLELN